MLFRSSGAIGLLLTPEPTMLTKAGGIALGIHSLDTIGAGVKTLYTGQIANTLTQQGAEYGALKAGFTPGNARYFGMGADLVAGAGPSLAVGINRRLAISAAENSDNILSVTFPRAITPATLTGGHNVVGVTSEGAQTWGHLVLGTQANVSTATLGDAAYVTFANSSRSARVTNIAVSSAGAARAESRLLDWIRKTEPVVDAAGNTSFSLLWGWTKPASNYQTCATIATDVLRSGGVAMPTWAVKPSLVYFGANWGYLFTAGTSAATTASTNAKSGK